MQQDYTKSGFDDFLSRSVDNLPQVNLDSTGPISTQTRFDTGQQSGGIGDSFNIGKIQMDGRKNNIILNDGQVTVNDSRSNFNIALTGSQINYKDNTGNIAMVEGVLPDKSVGFRLQNTQGLGLAQFSRDVNGNVAMKVAQSGIEVANATNDQLIFNSAQDIFKIVKTGTLSLTHTVSATPTTTTTTSTPHLLTYTPALLAFITLDPAIMSGALSNSTVPNPYPILFITGGSSALTLVGQAEVYIDSTNVYFTLRTYGLGNGTYNCSAKYYLLQETFA